MSKPTANVYVDGFNLYRQKVEHHPDAKWLDLHALAQALIPTHRIGRVRYFTALVRPALGTDPRSPIRQQTYIRALQTNPAVTVHEGQFRNDTRSMPAVPISFDDAGEIIRVKVRKTEEKGSDVNLASYMVFDACREDADLYVLVSNDSDFVAMLTILSEELNKNGRYSLLSSAPTVGFSNESRSSSSRSAAVRCSRVSSPTKSGQRSTEFCAARTRGRVNETGAP